MFSFWKFENWEKEGDEGGPFVHGSQKYLICRIMNMHYQVERYSVLRQQTSCQKDACWCFCHLYWYQFTYFFSIYSRNIANILIFTLIIMRKKNCWYSIAEICEIISITGTQAIIFCMRYTKRFFSTWSICKSKPSDIIKSVTDVYFLSS